MKFTVKGLTPANVFAGKANLNKRAFLRLVVRGWKEHKKGYVSGVYRGEPVGNPNTFCAVGVAASELNVEPSVVCGMLHVSGLRDRLPIYTASDNAGSKTKAIKALRALPEW